MEVEISKQMDVSLEGLLRMDSFLTVLNDFASKWCLSTNHCREAFLSVQEAKMEINQLKCNVLRFNKQCVVLGKTSAGKSTLINAVIGRKLLPAGFGVITNCFVDIKGSPNEESYVLMENGTDIYSRLDLTRLQKECRQLQSNLKTHIKVFLSTDSVRYLKNNFTIIDTPGIGSCEFDENTRKMTRESDLIILVISSLSEFSRSEKEILQYQRNKYSTSNIIIVYNFWDIPNENEEFQEVRERQEKNALDFLEHEMKPFEKRKDEKNVYFLSSLEELKLQINDKIPDLENIESRKEEFKVLRERLMDEVIELPYTRRMSILKTAGLIIGDTFEGTERCFDAFKLEIADLVEKIKTEIQNMERFNELNDQINRDVKKSFKAIVENVIKTGKKLVEKKSDENSVALSNLIKDIFDTENMKLRDKIRDLIVNTDCNEFCKNVLKEIYFTRYFNNNEGFNKDNEEIRKNLFILNKASKIEAGLHTGFTSALSAASVASGGITVGAVAAIETTTSIVSMVSGKNLSVFSLFGYLAKPLHFIWDKEEGNIRKQFTDIEDSLRDSLKNFPSKVDDDIVQIIEPLEENFNILKNFLDNVKAAISEFRRSSFLYM